MEKCNRCKSERLTIFLENKYHNLFKCLECGYMVQERIKECCRNVEEIVTIEHRQDNLIRLYHQCLNCGGAFRTKPLSHKAFSNKIRTEFSITKFDNWEINRENENIELQKVIRQNNYETSKYAKYVEYLSSIEWKSKREQILVRDNYTCQDCKIKPAEEVHHKTYDNLFNEPLEDLISLCKKCHTEIHKVLHIEEMKKIREQIEINKKNIP